ncbi:MAG: aspartate aminotransferase family protein [Desulfomicrobiaceae bacterium]|nr:aspartate aminotransferase family protein [Desulfomicrobiaceae bacterium]
MTSSQLMERESQLLCPTYARYPLAVSRGEGMNLYTPEGERYTDLLSGIAVCALGHCHPEVTAAICAQAGTLVHVSNLLYQEEQLILAEKLLATAPGMERAFFCNSGAEANEGAIKLARRFMREVRGQDRFRIITLSGSFHGRTLATLTATGQDKVKIGFGPLPEGFTTVPFGDAAALKSAMDEHTAAVLVEPIQGEGGVRPLPADYAATIQRLCREQGVLLICDEIQTGVGRTGHFWAYQGLGLTPDIMTIAKGIAGGLPMGAVLTTAHVAQGFPAGSHGTTFGGNALVSRVAATVLDIIERDGLVARAAQLGTWLKERLQVVAQKHPGRIQEVRGAGLMVGIELTTPGKAVWQELLARRYLVNLTQDTVLRLLPPLIVDESHLEGFCIALEEALAATAPTGAAPTSFDNPRNSL